MDDPYKAMIQEIVKVLCTINKRLEYIEDHLGVQNPDPTLYTDDADIPAATVLEFAKK